MKSLSVDVRGIPLQISGQTLVMVANGQVKLLSYLWGLSRSQAACL